MAQRGFCVVPTRCTTLCDRDIDKKRKWFGGRDREGSGETSGKPRGTDVVLK